MLGKLPNGQAIKVGTTVEDSNGKLWRCLRKGRRLLADEYMVVLRPEPCDSTNTYAGEQHKKLEELVSWQVQSY